MSDRTNISKKLRFEVFKRDSFTCQYCGSKAPDVVLNVDHIRPVADGGTGDVLNLVTACFSCNSGKGARTLDDRSVVERQRSQIEELQERREQLEMMLAWRDNVESEKTDLIEEICERIGTKSGSVPNEAGKAFLRKWMKKYPLPELLRAIDEAFDIYLEFRKDEATHSSWEKAFQKIPVLASINRQAVDKPYIPKLCYVQGILRRRFRDKRGQYVSALEEMHLDGASLDVMESIAKKADTWDEYCEEIAMLSNAAGQGQG